MATPTGDSAGENRRRLGVTAASITSFNQRRPTPGPPGTVPSSPGPRRCPGRKPTGLDLGSTRAREAMSSQGQPELYGLAHDGEAGVEVGVTPADPLGAVHRITSDGGRIADAAC